MERSFRFTLSIFQAVPFYIRQTPTTDCNISARVGKHKNDH